MTKTTTDIAADGLSYRKQAIEARGKLVRWYAGAWEFLLSRDPMGLWGFSAMLYPLGRSSTEDDWKYLGRWVAAVGIPKDTDVVGNTIYTSPNAVHKWIWMEKP